MHVFMFVLLAFCVFFVSLGLFFLVVFDLVSSIPSQEIGWEEHVQNKKGKGKGRELAIAPLT